MGDGGREFAIFHIEDYSVARLCIIAKQQLAQRVLDMGLDGTFQGTGSVLHIKAGIGDMLYSNNAFYYLLLPYDPELKEALSLMK